MQRPGKNQRRRARERANAASAIDRLNSAIKTQQKERIHKPEQHKQTVTTSSSRGREPAASGVDHIVHNFATTQPDLTTWDVICATAARTAALTASELSKIQQDNSTGEESSLFPSQQVALPAQQSITIDEQPRTMFERIQQPSRSLFERIDRQHHYPGTRWSSQREQDQNARAVRKQADVHHEFLDHPSPPKAHRDRRLQ
jgi:hypothetical protein